MFLFDALMLGADRHDAFLVDLSGPVRVDGETVDGDQAVLTLDGEGIDGPLVLRMGRLSTGRWAVRDVAAVDREEPVWPRPSP